MKMEIISREQIRPSSPTPSHLKNFKLSLFDQITPPSYFPLILFYSPQETSKISQSEASSTLKRSLSDVLTQFYPLAGKTEGESSVNCDDQGVDYAEARVESQLFNIIERPQIDMLSQLIPFKPSDIELSREKLLSIQVSFFNCGGIVIGACISHRIADGCTLSMFIGSWAATARQGGHMTCPSFLSSSLFPPREPLGYNPRPPMPEQGLVTKRLIFTASAIAALKAELAATHPTRVEVVTALIWKCAADQGTSMAFHPVNIRRRMVPAVPDNSFGNLFLMAEAVSEGGDDLDTLVGKIRAGIRRIDGDYIRERQGKNGFELYMGNLRRITKVISTGEVKVLRFTSWCGFPIYEADFGWGKPSWVSIASLGVKNSVILMDSRCPGGIEAWVTFLEEDMFEFEQIPLIQSFISPSSTS